MNSFDYKSAFSQWSSDSDGQQVARIAQEKAMYTIANQLYQAMQELDLGKSQLAQQVDKKPAFITRVLKGDHNMTIKTLVQLAFALNKEVHIELRDRSSLSYQREHRSDQEALKVSNND